MADAICLKPTNHHKAERGLPLSTDTFCQVGRYDTANVKPSLVCTWVPTLETNHTMAIDSVRLLIDSAGPLWQRLSGYGSIDRLPLSDSFDDWIKSTTPVPRFTGVEEQALRRDYRRLRNLLTDIETLLRSRSQTLALVRAWVVPPLSTDQTQNITAPPSMLIA